MPAADWNDVRFDYEGSLALARLLWQLADTIDTLGAQRRRRALAALADWRGRFGLEFGERVEAELADLCRHADDLRGTAIGWARAWADAINQQNRRLHARAVWRTERDRDLLDHIGGLLFGHDDIPPDPPQRAVPAAPSFHPTGGLVRY